MGSTPWFHYAVVGVAVTTVAISPSEIRAQVDPDTINPDGIENNGLVLEVQEPLGRDGGRINCDDIGEDNCRPLNAASCGDAGDGRRLNLLLTASPPIQDTSINLLVFLDEAEDCVFQQASDLEGRPIQSTRLDDPGDPLLSVNAFNFPADGGGSTGTYGSVQGILDASGACEEAIDQGSFRLCFVASTNSDDIAENGEPSAALLMLIDTAPPPAPSRVNVRPLDGGIEIEVDSEADDVRRWTAEFRRAEDDGLACEDWPESEIREVDVVNQGVNNFEIELDNGVTYEVCLFAQDDAGNLGERSEVLRVTPTDECDFIECFPGSIDDGYCGASPGSGLWTVLAVLGLLSRKYMGNRS